MRFSYSICTFFWTLLFISSIQCQLSVFDIVDKPDTSSQSTQQDNQYRFAQTSSSNQPVNSMTSVNNSKNTPLGLDKLIDLAKDKIIDPVLKDKFTAENLANFFAAFFSGNNFMSNLEVKEETSLHNVIVKDQLKVHDKADIHTLMLNNLHSRVFNISEENNEIVFDPDAVIKLNMKKNRHSVNFKTVDLFESITFFKYLISQCGSRLEKCNMHNLLKDHNKKLSEKLNKKIDESMKNITSEFRKLKEEKKQIIKEKSNLRSQVNAGNKKSEILKNSSDNFKFSQKEKEDADSSLSSHESIAELEKKLIDDYPIYSKFLNDPYFESTLSSYYYGV